MSSIESWLVDTITVARQTGFDDGDPVFGDQVSVRARQESGSQLVIGPDGNEVQAQHVIATVDEITVDDRVWLIGDDDQDINAARHPLAVKRARALDGSGGHFESFF